MLSFHKKISLPLLITSLAMVFTIPSQSLLAKDNSKQYVKHHSGHQAKHKRHGHKGKFVSNHKKRAHHGKRHQKRHAVKHHRRQHSRHNTRHHQQRHHNNRHFNHQTNRHNNHGVTFSFGYGDNIKYPSYSNHTNLNTHYNTGKNCRPTYKYQYDSYGNQTRINGTLCYDHYGKAYIVPGSRYIASTSYN